MTESRSFCHINWHMLNPNLDWRTIAAQPVVEFTNSRNAGKGYTAMGLNLDRDPVQNEYRRGEKASLTKLDRTPLHSSGQLLE